MAAPMIPPAAAPDFLAAHGWAGREIQPLAGDASFRRYFRVVDGDAPGGADGRAAAARGPAAVRRRRRMAGARRACRAPAILARDLDARPAAARRFRRRPAARGARRRAGARARALRARDRSCSSISTRTPPMPGLPAARARPVARRAAAVPRLVLPGARPRRRRDGLSRRLARRCWRRSPPTASARSPCCATIMPRTSC